MPTLFVDANPEAEGGIMQKVILLIVVVFLMAPMASAESESKETKTLEYTPCYDMSKPCLCGYEFCITALEEQSIAKKESRELLYSAKKAAEAGDYQGALQHIENGLAVEPGHPVFFSEKGYILSSMKNYDAAYQEYLKVLDMKPEGQWMNGSDLIKAKALRGAGYVLIEFGRLDEAEALYLQSLILDPANELATNELKYIVNLRLKKSANN